jgi:hypothetical protein
MVSSNLVNSVGATEKYPIPKKASTLNKFVPSPWKIEERIFGDLNRDGVKDVALQLLEKLPPGKEEASYPQSRLLVVLLKRINGYELIGSCGLLGPQDGGVRGADLSVIINKGVLIISYSGGSNDGWYQTDRFRFDPKKDKMMLIGVDQRRDKGTEWVYTGRSINLLTHQRIDEAGKLTDVPLGNGIFKIGFVPNKRSRSVSNLKPVSLDDWNNQHLPPLPEPTGSAPSDE